jgi:hypothetical protein
MSEPPTNEPADLYHLAGIIGDLQSELAQRIPRLVSSADERDKSAKDGLAELQAKKFLSDGEVAKLREILHALHSADVSPSQQAETIERVAKELTAAKAGPLAVAIAGVASTNSRSLARFNERRGVGSDVAADIGDFSTWQECAAAGAIVGATAGLLGGPAGVLLGAAAGAIGGAAGFEIAQALKS